MNAYHPPRGLTRHLSALLGLLTLLAVSDSWAEGWFLKIEGVAGQVQEGALAGWTPVELAGALASRLADPANGAPGEVAFTCELRKAVDFTTPWLLRKCLTGEASPQMTLAYILDDPRATHYRISLKSVLVSSLAQAASGDPTEPGVWERVELAFEKIEFTVFDLDPNGGITGGLTGLFDQTTGLGGLKSRPPFKAVVARQAGQPGLTVTWPAETGHRYQLLVSGAIGQSWTRLEVVTASEDGLITQLVPVATPMLFLRVEEID